MKKIKVLIVDDSPLSLKLLKGILLPDPEFEIVGTAQNGAEAVNLVKMLNPDVVSMDINMPLMNGIEATREIMSTNPVPIVIVSTIYNSTEIEAAIKELEAGAVFIMPKPFGPGQTEFQKSSSNYIRTLKLMSEVKVVRRNSSMPIRHDSNHIESLRNKPEILAIGASAGGPEALRNIFKKIEKDFPLPILIAQHIDENFSEGFASWLNSYSKIPVKIAENGEKIRKGNVYLSPGGINMSVIRGGIILLSNKIENSPHKPSINHLFKSIGSVYGDKAIAILLSGMGNDGAEELMRLKTMGVFTIVQNEGSCLVFGMPGEAVKLGAACRITSPDKMADEIYNLITKN